MTLNFSEEKQKLLARLDSFQNNLVNIEQKYQLDLSELKEKVDHTVTNLQKEVFSIAFFGAFADGKSTVLSALTDRLDIKIAPEPTTDTIQTYPFGDYLIIDTPGLFSDNQLHNETTRKFISEANIILFTVDAVNPLKDSHLPTIKWLLSDLKKEPSTIFVINRMDQVVDLEDESAFTASARIKKNAVINVLKKAQLDEPKRILCIAADPNRQGLQYWKEHGHEYRKLSRIGDLEQEIYAFKQTYKNDLILKAGISVLRHASSELLGKLDGIKKKLIQQNEVLKNQAQETDRRIKILEKDVNRSFVGIKEDLLSLREDVFAELDAISEIDGIPAFFTKHVGKDGYIIQERINLLIQKHTEGSISESKILFESILESLNYHADIRKSIFSEIGGTTGQTFLKGLFSAPQRAIADIILKVRNILSIPFKFKPWDAMKLAKFLKGVPILAEALNGIFSFLENYKLGKAKEDIRKGLESGFYNLFKELTPEAYMSAYFPFLSESQKILLSLQDDQKSIGQSVEAITCISEELGTLKNLDNKDL